MSHRKISWSRIPPLLIIVLLATINISQAPAAKSNGANLVTAKKYLIDWAAIKTPIGTSTLDAATAEKFTQEVIYAFNEFSSGLVQFEKGEFLGLLTSNKALEEVGDFVELLGDRARKPPSGYEKVITIGITTKTEKNPYGMAISGGSFSLLWIEPHSYLLFHEMAHNFGAGHAHSIVCTGAPGAQKCKMDYMGDYGDVTGAYKLATSLNKPLFRVNGVFLDTMGLINKEQIEYADGDLETWLKPIYPINSLGTKIIYLPLQGSSKVYAIEYRAPIGVEEGLKLEKLPYKNFNSPISNVPSYGLQIRLVGSGFKKDIAPFPIIESDFSNLSNGDTALLVNSDGKRQGLDPGSTITLADGSVVSFLSYDQSNGARVKITRAPDKQAPIMELSRMAVYGSWIIDGENRVLRKNSNGEYSWPNLRFFFNKLVDDRRIVELELLLNGTNYKKLEIPVNNSLFIDARVEQMGDHELTVRATDSSGNRSEIIQKLSLKPYILPKPFVEIEAGRTTMKIQVSSSMYGLEPDNKLTYSLSNLSSGKLVKVEQLKDATEFYIEDIVRNSKVEFSVEVQDAFGNVSSSQTYSEEVNRSICTKFRCFVGETFNYSDRNWTVPAPALKLQLLKDRKWQTIATATAVSIAESNSKFPFSYNLNYIHQVPGAYTLRVIHKPFKYKGKSYSGYQGKAFKQVIEP